MIFIKKVSKILIAIAICLVMFSGHFSAFAASQNPMAGRVNVSAGNLNIRSSPSSSSAVISKAAKDTYLTLHTQSDDWWYVEYDNNKFGYCHNAYILQTGGKARKIYTNSSKLNVRSGAGTNYAVIGKLNKGETVVILSSDTYWSKILFDGNKTGYVYNTYLGPTSTTSSPTESVNLSVPSFKQYDNRWADIKIGTQGKTMSQIGCATTGIAMMESYRTGTIITPADMRNKLSYTSSGSVYWPSNYTAVTNSTAYLSAISKLLKSGKPVLLGLKNAYGSQHWVIVKGYNGAGLEASNFSINDPGSGTRTTLQHILNYYPIFYKYFYY